jgi:protein kinase-like protein/PEGA domain-containing protein
MSAGGEHGSGRADPLVGRVLSDRYRILRLIGEGGIGRVYLGEHLETGREVALKVLLPEYAGNLPLVDIFLEEARTVSRLGHENIIDIYYGGRSPDGYAFLVMERLPGMDLADTLALSGPLPWERARPLFQQMAGALLTVHQHGILHGDIKPANLFVVNDGVRHDFIKVLDFGVAKAVGLGRARNPDERVPVVGTPQYIAPEQFMPGAAPDTRADLYSLGCVMYRTLTGVVPFSAETPLAILTMHAHEQAIAPRVRRPDLDIPPSVEAIVLRAMEKDPARRFADMNEMGEAVTRARFGSTFATQDPAPAQFRMRDPIVLRARRRRRLLVATLVASALFAATGTLMVIRALMPATVDVVLSPADASLVVDGEPVAARGATTLRLGRGLHRLSASRPGYLTAARDLTVIPGGRHDVALQLAVSPQTGVAMTSEPAGALIYLDGQPVAAADGTPARTDRTLTAVRPGRHTIELRSPGGLTWQQSVQVQPDRIVPIRAVLPRPPAPPPGKGRRSSR